MSDERGPAPGPEPLPEQGPESGPVSVPDAGRRLGISERAVRKRIHAGTLRAEPFGRSFMVWLSDDADPVGPEPGPVLGPEPYEAQYRVTPADVEQAIERTGAKYVADMAALYDRIAAEVGRLYEGQLAAKDETIAAQRDALATKDQALAADALALAELRRRAEAAEAGVARQRQDREAAQPAPAGPGGQGARAVVQGDAPGMWGRLRGWWDGGDR